MEMKRRQIHEKYHLEGKIQKRIISDKNFTYRNSIQILKKLLKRRKSILDIGCGVGTIDFYLASKGKNVTGIDISQIAIDLANASSKQLKLDHKLHFRRLDFPTNDIKGKFDIVLLSEVLEHLIDDIDVLKNVGKLLDRKNGLVVISTPSRNAPLYKLGVLKGFDDRVGHLRRYSEEELSLKLNKTGYEIVSLYKTEGALRNFLFTNKFGGFLIKFLKGFLSDLVAILDGFLVPLFGESQIYVVARKR